MLLSYMALSCLNMSQLRAIWTRFKSNSVIFGQKTLDLVQDLGPRPGLCEVRRLEWRIHSGRKDEKTYFWCRGKIGGFFVPFDNPPFINPPFRFDR